MVRMADTQRSEPGPTLTTDGGTAASVHCQGCGEQIEPGVDSCPACEAPHLDTEAFAHIKSTADKDRDWGMRWLRKVPIVLPFIIWRQTRIENAQRELTGYLREFVADETDTVYCHNCGTSMPQTERICPDCDHENQLASINTAAFDVHDPAEHETNLSNHWWVGPALAPILGLVAFFGASNMGYASVGGYLLFGGGILAAGLGVLDRRYVRANSTWSPSYVTLFGLLWPILNLGLAYYYFHKRVNVLGWGKLR